MQTLTAEKEVLILTALAAKVGSVPGARNVIADEPLLDSKQDVLDTICIQNTDDETEVVYIKIDFLGFEDNAEEGCEDNPLTYLDYNLHVFQGYKEVRADGSSSATDIKRLVLNLRNRFLETDAGARALVADCETLPLRQDKFIILDNDPLTGAYGHFVDLIARVEIL